MTVTLLKRFGTQDKKKEGKIDRRRYGTRNFHKFLKLEIVNETKLEIRPVAGMNGSTTAEQTPQGNGGR